ncbi:hypothetical protein [Halohasta salina]|uniref:hypothetical protein n=1 Tax=Halohasta salina TaxID=2961621 RepID=UPI0020A27699|nr:hypothetical protein [Halohasta salina]
MDRRKYLAVGGTVAVAGCLGFFEGDSEADADSEADTDPDGEQSTGGSVSNTEPEPTEEASDDGSEDGGSEDEGSPDDAIELERALARAERQYRRGLAEYAGAVDIEDATFLHVYPSTDVETNNARAYLDRAGEILWEDARDYANTEADRERVREYRTYDDRIGDLARIQRFIHRVYSYIDSTDKRTLYASAPSELEKARRHHEDLGEVMEELEVYMDELQVKYDQQAWQLTLLERMFAGLVTSKGAHKLRKRSVRELGAARDEFEQVRDELDDPTSAPPEDYTDEPFLELATDWYELLDRAYRQRSASGG